MVPRKTGVVGFGGMMASSPVWGDEKRHIEKQRDGRGLGLRWPPFNWKIQQSNRIRRPGRRDVGEEVPPGWSVWGDVMASIWAAI